MKAILREEIPWLNLAGAPRNSRIIAEGAAIANVDPKDKVKIREVKKAISDLLGFPVRFSAKALGNTRPGFIASGPEVYRNEPEGVMYSNRLNHFRVSILEEDE